MHERADHWLYNIIPPSREETNFLTFIPWMLFGNDDDGIFGENYVDGWYKRAGSKPSLWLAVKWWFRNPLLNLCTRVINWPRERVRVLYAKATGLPGRWWFTMPQFRWYYEPGDYRERPKQFALQAWPPYLVGQGDVLEGYAGWGSHDGRFGFALRSARARDAADL